MTISGARLLLIKLLAKAAFYLGKLTRYTRIDMLFRNIRVASAFNYVCNIEIIGSKRTGNGMIVGYARVSTVDQSNCVQIDDLTAHGAEKVFEERLSGTSAANRRELEAAIEFVREGDTLIVTRLDRLARSMNDLHQIIARLERKGVAFRCTQQGGVDTSSVTGKLMLGVLAAVAEFETGLRKERQAEGIAKAKQAGAYKGRKPSIDVKHVRELKAGGLGPSAIAAELGITRQSVYRLA